MTQINEFLSSVSVIDTETTNLDTTLAEIVEIAEAHWMDGAWSTKGMIIGAVNGIPPAASAKNNISNRMIKDKPPFADVTNEVRDLLSWPHKRFYVAHNAAYDRAVLNEAWKKSGSSSDQAVCIDDSRWICTWRLSRHLLSVDFDDIEYGLNYLRYLLDLPVPDSLRLHRAADDTYLCAVLLEHLVEIAVRNGRIDISTDIGSQLNTLCWSPIIQDTWPFGKYRGKLLSDLPTDYYTWAINNMDVFNDDSSGYDRDLAESVRQILEARIVQLS
jgi:DNA polymerase III epsilon subunit-like protein